MKKLAYNTGFFTLFGKFPKYTSENPEKDPEDITNETGE